MKIYTRTGDQGQTGLFGGRRVSKASVRLEAYGTLDELNSLLGLLRLNVSKGAGAGKVLEQIQTDIFVLCALLATPPDQMDLLQARMKKPTWEIHEIEADIDRLMALAPPQKSFILPGGTQASAHAHWARTVCRRAERLVVALSAQDEVPDLVLVYLNRLSDWLYALARAENAVAGVNDIEWNP